jgi:GR25 family glycosyltransferase involved in LPS biosynthesis
MINNFFEKIYLLNLDKRSDKLEIVSKKLKKRNINFERFSAIDGSLSKFDNIWNNIINNYNDFDKKLGRKAIRSRGAMGCMLSIESIILDAKDKKYKNILILEDDIIFNKEFDNRILKIKNISTDWALIYLGASQYDWNNIKFFNEDFYFAEKTCGTFAFGISSSYYDKILNLIKNYEVPIDTYFGYYFQPKFLSKCFVFKENLIIADVTSSDIRESRNQKLHASLMRWDLNRYLINE